MVEVSEIFRGFCRLFSSSGLTSAPTASTWKYRVYYFFDNLGRMLGYEVFTEDTFTKKSGVGSRLVKKRIDMTWRTFDLSEYVMALEYENTRKIDNDIKKLAAISGLRILVMIRFHFTDEEIIEKIKAEVNQYLGDDPFLVLILPRRFQTDEPFEKLTAILLDSKGKVCGSGSAEGYVGKDGVCAFRRITWTGNTPK